MNIEEQFIRNVVNSYAQQKEKFLQKNLPKAFPDNIKDEINKAINKNDKNFLKRQMDNYDISLAEDEMSSLSSNYNQKIYLIKGKCTIGEDIHESDNVEIIVETELDYSV